MERPEPPHRPHGASRSEEGRALDRLVHHAVILELTGGSIRNEVAQERAANSDSSERPAD